MRRLFLILLALGTSLLQSQTTAPSWRTAIDTTDSDQDGVPDSADFCVQTPPSRPFITQGCAALDLAQKPETIAKPITAGLAQLAARLRSSANSHGTIYALNSASQSFDTAVSQIRSGNVCDGSQTFSYGMRSLSQAEVSLQGMIDFAIPALPSTRTRTEYADATDADTASLCSSNAARS